MSKRALFNVTVAGTNITTALMPVLLGLQVSDKVGTHTDSADFEIDDTAGRIVLPQTGAPVSIALGWDSEGMRVVFEGTVDEVKSSGTRSAGRRLRITAKGMDTTGRAKEGQQRHWDGATVETILHEAAAHAGITQIEIDPALRTLTRGYFEMRDESLIAMGERLAREIGGNFRVTGGRIVFSKRNADYATAVAATWGQNLHSWDIAPRLGRPQFGTVRGRWYLPGKIRCGHHESVHSSLHTHGFPDRLEWDPVPKIDTNLVGWCGAQKMTVSQENISRRH